MLNLDVSKHCSLNKAIRVLFYKKQKINNSRYYSEEEKKKLTMEIEESLCNKWNEMKSNL